MFAFFYITLSLSLSLSLSLFLSLSHTHTPSHAHTIFVSHSLCHLYTYEVISLFFLSFLLLPRLSQSVCQSLLLLTSLLSLSFSKFASFGDSFHLSISSSLLLLSLSLHLFRFFAFVSGLVYHPAFARLSFCQFPVSFFLSLPLFLSLSHTHTISRTYNLCFSLTLSSVYLWGYLSLFFLFLTITQTLSVCLSVSASSHFSLVVSLFL